MKKVLLILVFISSIVLANENIVKLSKSEVEALKEKVTIFKGNGGIQLIKVYDRKSDNLYHFTGLVMGAQGKVQKFEGFIDKNNYNVFIGNGYNQSGKKISFPVNADIVKSSVVMRYGKGKKEIYLVTDPECPYCVKLEKALGEKLVSKYKVNYIIFPLSFHHKATPMLQWILRVSSDEERYKRFYEILIEQSDDWKKIFPNRDFNKYKNEYYEVLNGKSNEWKNFFQTQKELQILQENLKKTKQAVDELEVKGTPTVLSADFISLNPNAL